MSGTPPHLRPLTSARCSAVEQVAKEIPPPPRFLCNLAVGKQALLWGISRPGQCTRCWPSAGAELSFLQAHSLCHPWEPLCGQIANEMGNASGFSPETLGRVSQYSSCHLGERRTLLPPVCPLSQVAPPGWGQLPSGQRGSGAVPRAEQGRQWQLLEASQAAT